MAVLSHISKIILITLISFLFLPCDAEVQYVEYYCYDNGNYTQNSTYQENLVQALSDLYSEASVDSFHSTTSGSGDDQVSALYYCRGDLTLAECQRCVKPAALGVFNSCFGQKEAIIWYEFCTLRYANRRIVGEEDVGRGVYWLSQSVWTTAESLTRRWMQDSRRLSMKRCRIRRIISPPEKPMSQRRIKYTGWFSAVLILLQLNAKTA